MTVRIDLYSRLTDSWLGSADREWDIYCLVPTSTPGVVMVTAKSDTDRECVNRFCDEPISVAVLVLPSVSTSVLSLSSPSLHTSSSAMTSSPDQSRFCGSHVLPAIGSLRNREGGRMFLWSCVSMASMTSSSVVFGISWPEVHSAIGPICIFISCSFFPDRL